MSKYYTVSDWEGDYEYWQPHWDESKTFEIEVPEHVAKFTGLFTSKGERIVKTLREVGFGRDVD